MKENSELIFRNMQEEDLPAVASIELEAFPDSPWPEDSFRSCLSGGSVCRTLEESGKILGYCIVHRTLDEAEVYTIAVAASCRGRGYGRALLQDALGILFAQGVCQVFLEVRMGNAPAKSLYISEGFEQIAVRKGYYPNQDGTKEDAAVMIRRMNNAA